ncbi:MAG: 2-hydroxyacid dehydrogenase [Vicinamibacterales bacterium]
MSTATDRPRVLVTRRIPSSVVSLLDEHCTVDLYKGPQAIPRAELIERVQGKQALMCLLTDRIDGAVLEAGSDLRIVANIAVGFDNIDLAAARARGVVVTNTPDVLSEATAELTWGIILAVTRRITEGDRLLRKGGWKGWALDFMLGTELRGKQLGIVGMGRIGKAVAARAPAFGLRVAYAAEDPVDLTCKGAVPLPPMTRMSLDHLLQTSDVVSLHVPLTESTRHLINQTTLARMRRSAFLINTSRGPVVDEAALVWALRERVITGAGLDVFEREPEVHAGLLELENVVLVPHLGSATTETRTAMADLAARNVLAVVSGQPPLTPVQGQ